MTVESVIETFESDTEGWSPKEKFDWLERNLGVGIEPSVFDHVYVEAHHQLFVKYKELSNV